MASYETRSDWAEELKQAREILDKVARRILEEDSQPNRSAVKTILDCAEEIDTLITNVLR